MNQSAIRQQLPAEWISADKFRAYGQLITPSYDGKPYDETDAKLNLSNGIPRFYIMHLLHRGRKFHKITRHQLCTQCLGSLAAKDWYIAVCPPSSKPQPELDKMSAFRIPGNCFIKLEVGTWHAGPYFDYEAADFYNLELSDTNIVDHDTYDFAKEENLEFEIIDRK